MMFATLCLYAMILAASPIQDAPVSTPTPAPKAGVGAPATPKKEGAGPVMTPTDAKARARFVRFSKVLAELIDPVRFPTLDEKKISLLLGSSLTKNNDMSNEFTTYYESKRFDREWYFLKPAKPVASRAAPGESEFIEGFELSIFRAPPAAKDIAVGLNLKDGTQFTLADFKEFFKQEPVRPRPLPWPIPPGREMDLQAFVRGNIVVFVNCERTSGFCRTVGMNNDPEVRLALPTPQAQK